MDRFRGFNLAQCSPKALPARTIKIGSFKSTLTLPYPLGCFTISEVN